MKENLYTCDNPKCGKQTTYKGSRGWLMLAENSYLSLYLIKPAKQVSTKPMDNERHFCSVECLMEYFKEAILAQLR